MNTMKTIRSHTKLSFFGALLFAPLAFAGPSTPGGFFQPAKRTATKTTAAACCVTHQACADQSCCTVARHYYTSPSGRGLSWNNVRGCTKTCTINASEQRSICGKGKGV
jgi:hypothetical protein